MKRSRDNGSGNGSALATQQDINENRNIAMTEVKREREAMEIKGLPKIPLEEKIRNM